MPALAAQGVAATPMECRRVLGRLISEGGTDPIPRRGLRRELRDALLTRTVWHRPEVVERVTDAADGAVRYVFRLADGLRTEAVWIPLAQPGRATVCLSTQVGCAMGCTFCATGRLGLSRNLSTAEMVGCLLTLRDESPGRLTGVVFMGQGEPFHNYEAVIQAAYVACDPCGVRISADAITLSTVGLVPQLRRYTAEGHPFRLVVSLHSARPELRARLAPVAGRVSLDELASAIADHARATRDRVTVAYVLLGGVNTDSAEVEALQALLGDVALRVNLIDVNDARADGFRRATNAERNAFHDALQVLGAPVVRRYSVGASRNAACGMLAATAVDPGSQGLPI